MLTSKKKKKKVCLKRDTSITTQPFKNESDCRKYSYLNPRDKKIIPPTFLKGSGWLTGGIKRVLSFRAVVKDFFIYSTVIVKLN